MRRNLWELVRRLNEEEGKTIVLTTHYMEEAERLCDRVAIMDHGRILALDTPAALKRSCSDDGGPGVSAKAWLARLRALERISERESPNGEVADRAGVEAALVDVIAAADRHGLRLDDLRGSVTLEHVFINLTGRDLRE
jgi:ABC-2 type transport system ATP-binding protein